MLTRPSRLWCEFARFQDAILKYVSNKASGASESEDAMADPEATQLLWALLKVMCTHYGAYLLRAAIQLHGARC
jgi:alkylation response protein AidB-like acyl-CoA dehydrogenase